MRCLLALLLVLRVFAPGQAHAQDACADVQQQLASAQQQVDQDRTAADQLLQQIAPLAAVAPAELLAAAAQGNLPGVTPDVAASFAGIVGQIAAQIDTWRAANGSTGSSDYLRDLLTQVTSWESEFGALAPVQGAVPSLVQLGNTLGQLEQTAGSAQGDVALVDDLNTQLQQCQADAGAPEPTPSAADQAPQDQGGALCSVEGATGASPSECFALENDAAFKVWEACTEQYFAAEDEAFRTGGDLPANTCDPAWKAEQQAISDRWGIPVAP